jgi:hypothetical protein
MMGRMTNVEMTFFIAVDGGSRAVQRGWLTTVVQIQYFGFFEGRRRDEALPKDEAEAVSSSLLHGK